MSSAAVNAAFLTHLDTNDGFDYWLYAMHVLQCSITVFT